MSNSSRLGPAAAALFGLALLLSGCEPNNVLRVHTNVPELALLSARYMAETGGPIVIVEYHENLDPQLSGAEAADLLVGTGLHSRKVMDELADQNELLGENGLAAGDYYAFSFVKQREDTKLSVLAWDLPALLSQDRDEQSDFNESVMLPLEGLMDRAAQHTKKKKGSFSALGFSPLYSDEFIYLFFQYQGSGIGADRRGYPDWRAAGMGTALGNLASWSDNYNGGARAETDFINKFAYAPINELLGSQRFHYAFSTASDYLGQKLPTTADISLHWPSWKNRLLILDNLVAAGIPLASPRKDEAIRFIRWLLNPEVQRTAMVQKLDMGIRSFGFLGGFSSYRQLTEQLIPAYYPAIRLRIPPESVLDFPAPHGMLWSEFKKEIFAPWVRRELLKANQPGETLERSVEQWLLQMGLNP